MSQSLGAREAVVAKIATNDALKPVGQRLINRIPGFENVDYLADALTRSAIYNDEGELTVPVDPYPMAHRCTERGHHRFEEELRSNCADCGTKNPMWFE